MATQQQRKEWLAGEFLQHHLNGAIQFGQREWLDSMLNMLDGNLTLCRFDSPLEMAFYVWWHIMSDVRGMDDCIEMAMQREVTVGAENFRLDFTLRDNNYSWARAGEEFGLAAPQIAVELDGHDFHERTKDQVIRRDMRDRALQSAGWTVCHVSGSLFHRDPAECVWGVYMDASGLIWNFRNKVHALRSKVGANVGEEDS